MGNCETIQIQNCSNVSVFALGVKQVCSVDKCENINLTLTSFILRIGNTIDSSFYYYGPNGPILYGDNRTIQLGPHNANYIDLPYAIKDIDMQLTSQLAIKFQDPIILNNNKNNFKIVLILLYFLDQTQRNQYVCPAWEFPGNWGISL